METERQASMKARWERLVGKAGLPDDGANALFHNLVDRYREAHRHYHTLEHIEHCLRQNDVLPELENRPEFELALWFHDAIYDPKRHDNESASAALAKAALERLGWEPTSSNDVARLIRATDHGDRPTTPDERRIVDIDLSILGQPDSLYDHYAAAIRREYRHVPEPAYRKGRAALLHRFLERSPIFSTPGFQERFETRARENLARELESLR